MRITILRIGMYRWVFTLLTTHVGCVIVAARQTTFPGYRSSKSSKVMPVLEFPRTRLGI